METKSLSSIFKVFSVEGMDGEVVVAFLLVLVTSIIAVLKLLSYLKQSLVISVRGENGPPLVPPPQPSYNRSEEPCPVCFSSISFAVETDCYHLFCGTCILGLIQYARHRNIMCPVCRAQVLMLYPVFTVEEYNHNSTSDSGLSRDNLISEIQEYNHLFSGGNRTIIQTIFELPIYVRRLWRSFNNPNDVYVQNRMKTLLYIILLLVVLYILFPFDLFPETNFGIVGFIDDVLVLAVSLMYLTSVYRSLFFNLENLN